ncbi:hypothetical protein ACROYT_G038074 [Oculina patagonica]
MEQIIVLRNIVEQAVEWNSSLYLRFVDYGEAFNSIHRGTLWKIMGCYGIPSKIVRMVQAMYIHYTSAVVDGDERSDWFEIRIFKSNVIAVLLYKCETWRMNKRDEAKLDTFLHKCVRRIFRIYWLMRVSNEEVGTISEQIKRRRWRWIGHVLRMDHQQNPRIALTLPPEGKRSRGRP